MTAAPRKGGRPSGANAEGIVTRSPVPPADLQGLVRFLAVGWSRGHLDDRRFRRRVKRDVRRALRARFPRLGRKRLRVLTREVIARARDLALKPGGQS